MKAFIFDDNKWFNFTIPGILEVPLFDEVPYFKTKISHDIFYTYKAIEIKDPLVKEIVAIAKKGISNLDKYLTNEAIGCTNLFNYKGIYFTYMLDSTKASLFFAYKKVNRGDYQDQINKIIERSKPIAID